MRLIGNTLFILAAAATVAAIWSPIGAWWQHLATAALLFLAGAYAHGTALAADKPTEAPTNTSITARGLTAEEAAKACQREYEKRRRLNYGQKASR